MSKHKKIGRNDPCWCGSGKKLKHCCKTPARPNQMSRQEILQSIDIIVKKKTCLHPDASSTTCRGGIVKAHIIQRSRQLKYIADNGHVLRFRERKPDEIDQGKLLYPVRIGINKASTFTGFCGKHDHDLFVDIEEQPLQRIDARLACLFGFRALCKEYYLTVGKVELASFLLTNAHRVNIHGDLSRVRENFKNYLEGCQRASTDLIRHKASYDYAISANDFSSSFYYCIYIDSYPDVLCSGATQPEYDFNGQLLQNISDLTREFEFVTCSLLLLDKGGVILFNWIDKQVTSEQLIRSLNRLSDTDIAEAVFVYCIETFEDLFFSPIWWKNLTNEKQNELINRYYDVLLNRERRPDYLTLRGEKAVDWRVIRREANFPLD